MIGKRVPSLRRSRRAASLSRKKTASEIDGRFGETLPVVMVLETADTELATPAEFLIAMVRLFVGDEAANGLARRVAHQFRDGYNPPAAAMKAMGQLGYSWDENGLVRPTQGE